MAGCDGWLYLAGMCIWHVFTQGIYLLFALSLSLFSIQFDSIRFNSFGRAGGGGPSFDDDDDDIYIHPSIHTYIYIERSTK